MGLTSPSCKKSIELLLLVSLKVFKTFWLSFRKKTNTIFCSHQFLCFLDQPAGVMNVVRSRAVQKSVSQKIQTFHLTLVIDWYWSNKILSPIFDRFLILIRRNKHVETADKNLRKSPVQLRTLTARAGRGNSTHFLDQTHFSYRPQITGL